MSGDDDDVAEIGADGDGDGCWTSASADLSRDDGAAEMAADGDGG